MSKREVQFRNWLLGNPQAMALFAKLANQIRDAGHSRYSATALVQIMRWHSDLAQTELFKINNNHTKFLALELVEIDPSFEGFFETRESRK